MNILNFKVISEYQEYINATKNRCLTDLSYGGKFDIGMKLIHKQFSIYEEDDINKTIEILNEDGDFVVKEYPVQHRQIKTNDDVTYAIVNLEYNQDDLTHIVEGLVILDNKNLVEVEC